MIGLEPGSELGGFVIEAVAGRGGMGIVYRARQLRPARTVALKVIAPELAADPTFRSRFESESEIAAQIEHPNVIPVYAVDDSDGVLYIAMRFVEGTDLRAVMAREGPLDPQRAAALTEQVARALDAAHARGLVHRDVKPSNVLIATEAGGEHPYLTDFGLARHVGGNTRGMTATGALVGTIDYVAPEQVRGERVDARTDIYSLGCMLFELLTGTVPFPRDNDVAKLFAHGAEPPPSARARRPELPAALDAVLARAMAKDPADRYPSAGDFGRAACAAAAHQPVAGAERSVATGAAAPGGASGAPSAPRAPVTRRRALLAAGLAAAVLIVLVAVLVAGGSGGGGGKSGATHPDARSALVPAGARLVEQRSLSAPRSFRYTVALSVPKGSSAPGAPAALTMSLLGARSGQPIHVIQRERLPAPPYRFAQNSYVTQFQLSPNPDGSGSIGLSWYVHPGDRDTKTCYFEISFGGIQLDKCG